MYIYLVTTHNTTMTTMIATSPIKINTKIIPPTVPPITGKRLVGPKITKKVHQL